MKKHLHLYCLLSIVILGFVVLFFHQNKQVTGQVQAEIEREKQKIIHTEPLVQKENTDILASTKPLFEILGDNTQDGDHRVAAVSLLIQSWSEKDKENAVQFILSSPFHSGALRAREFEITLRALLLEALAESAWGKKSISELQKIAAFSESSFLSQRAELYRKWLSGLGPNPKDLDKKVLTRILTREEL
jgi:hypothetical protein